MNLLQDIKQSFAINRNPLHRIIAINIAVFLVFALSKMIFFLAGAAGEPVITFGRYLMLPAAFSTLLSQPWSLITSLFMHDGIFHILFNMLWLFWIGNIVYEYLGAHKSLEIYFFSGLFGSLLFLVAYHVFPALVASVDSTYIIGASGCVLGIVFAAATLLPDYGIQLMFFGNIKLKWLAIVYLAIDLISIPYGNAGGHIAHIGGAAFGYLYIRFLYKIGGTLISPRFFELFSTRKKPKLYFKNESKQDPRATSEQVDAILDKISRSGYDSLTKKEKEILFKASKE